MKIYNKQEEYKISNLYNYTIYILVGNNDRLKSIKYLYIKQKTIAFKVLITLFKLITIDLINIIYLNITIDRVNNIIKNNKYKYDNEIMILNKELIRRAENQIKQKQQLLLMIRKRKESILYNVPRRLLIYLFQFIKEDIGVKINIKK